MVDTPANSDPTTFRFELQTIGDDTSSGRDPESGPSIAPGTVLSGRFVLERLLGSGGMGEVWLGRDRVLGRQVAAKVIRPIDPTLRERTLLEGSLRESFFDEAKIGASLAHPAIATVFDFGFFLGEPFIIFEYIDGDTLHDYMARRGRIPLQDAQLIVGPLAQALDYAHEHHIVHRDLKPENIRATRQGHFKILDLGLAKEFRSQTNWRSFAGTPSYTSPEQAAGLPCDGRADQYCLGLIAYEMVVGQRPFVSNDREKLLRMHIESTPPSPRLYVSENASLALLKALSKDPVQRFTTCTDFAVAFGCQTLTEASSTPKLLQLTRARASLPEVRSADRNPARRVRVGVTAEHLCLVYREEIRALPLGCIIDAASHGGFRLEIRYLNNGNENSLTLKFWSPWNRRRLRDLLQPLIRTKVDEELPEGIATVRPRVIQIRQAPIRHQVVGSVNYRDSGRARAFVGIEMQAALLGADAITEIERERVFQVGRILHRLSGIAIRAIDEEGREEIAARAQANEIAALTTRMLITLSVLLALTGATAFREGADRSLWTGTTLLYFLWPIAAAVLLRWLRWPEIIKPVVVTLPIMTGVLYAASALSNINVVPQGYFTPSFLIVELIVLAYPLRLAARGWRAFDSYSSVFSSDGTRRPRGGRIAGFVMWCILAWWCLILLGIVKQVTSHNARRPSLQAAVALELGLSEFRKGGREHLAAAEEAMRQSVALWSVLVSRPQADFQTYIGLTRARLGLGTVLGSEQKYPEAVKVLESAQDTFDICLLKVPRCALFEPADLRAAIQRTLTIYRSRASPTVAEAVAAGKVFTEALASYSSTPRDLKGAETGFTSALRLFTALTQEPDAVPDYSEQVGAILYDLGLVYIEEGKWPDAEKFFIAALEQGKLLSQRFPQYNLKENWPAQAQVKLDALRQSILQKKATIAAQELSAAVKLANSKPPDITAAQVKLQAAIRDWRELTEADQNYRPALAQSYFDLGWLYLTQQKYAHAEKSLRSAQRQLESIKAMTPEQQALHDRIHGILSERVMQNPQDSR